MISSVFISVFAFSAISDGSSPFNVITILFVFVISASSPGVTVSSSSKTI